MSNKVSNKKTPPEHGVEPEQGKLQGFARKIGHRLLLYPLIAVVVIAVIVVFLENTMIYFPSRYPEGSWNVSRSGFKPVDCMFSTEDGIELHATSTATRATCLTGHRSWSSLRGTTSRC